VAHFRNNLATKHVMEEGREYIMVVYVDSEGNSEQKLIDIYEAAEVINNLNELYADVCQELDEADKEAEFWRNMVNEKYSNLN
jgi:hypothetical protein